MKPAGGRAALIVVVAQTGSGMLWAFLLVPPLSHPSQHLDQGAVLIHPPRRTSAATMHAWPLRVPRPTRADNAGSR